jgi:hypothetical protein
VVDVAQALSRRPRRESSDRVVEEQVEPEFKRFILFRDGKAYFKEDVLEEPELIVDVGEDEILDFVRRYGASKVRQTSSGLWVFDETLYKQLVVYATALSTMKDKSALRLLKLAEAVRSLDEYSLHFWYAEIIWRYKKGKYWSGPLVSIPRVAKAFRVMYGVDE